MLDGRTPAGAFRDKLVVIGVTAGSQDRHRTPVDARIPGVELQAAAIATMFRAPPCATRASSSTC